MSLTRVSAARLMAVSLVDMMAAAMPRKTRIPADWGNIWLMSFSKLASGMVLTEMAVKIMAAYKRLKTTTDRNNPLLDVLLDLAEAMRCQTMGDMIQARVKDMVIHAFLWIFSRRWKSFG